jgi:hypothetical protein
LKLVVILKEKFMRNIRFICWFSVLILLNGCYTYSSLQSAKLLVKGKYEITPSYSSISFSNDGESEKVSDNFGIQLGLGISDKVNLRFRYEQISPDFPGINSYSFLSLEPKFSLEKDRVAFSVPFGLFTGSNIEESDAFQIHPSLYFTMPVSKNIEINFSPKYLIFLEENTDDLVAINAGLGLSTDLSKWAVRPEIGYLFNPGEEGHYFSFSLGVSLMP